MMGNRGFLLVLFSLLITPTLQQCTAAQNYVIVPANNEKNNAPNVIRLAVIGQLFGIAYAFPGSVMRFAAERFNNMTDFLPDTRIELAFLPNTSPDLSSNLLLTLFAIQNLSVHGIIGGISTTESRVIQLAAKLYNVPQISSHAVGSVLANKEEYPYYACTQPFDTIQIDAIVAQFRYFGWKKGLILYSDNDYGASYSSLVVAGSNAGVEFLGFTIPSGATVKSQIEQQMQLVKSQVQNNRYRIIVLYLTANSTALVMNVANDLGLVGKDYVYILSTNAAGIYTQGYFPEVLPYLQGSLGVILPSPSGPFYQQELDAYQHLRTTEGTRYAAYTLPFQFMWVTYDPVMTYAYAVDALLKRGVPFSQIRGKVLYDQILKTNYTGVSGEMVFNNPLGDRKGFYSITNYQGNVSVEVAQYSAITNNIYATRNFIFYDGTSNVPSDGTGRDYSRALAGGLGAIVSIGVLVAFFAIAMLVYHWSVFISKYGTFYCGVILTGVLTSYIAAFSLLPEPTDALCLVFPWFLGIAFTLVYGCLFIKAWILYRLWRYALQLKRMSITALTVVKYVGVALLVEIVLLVIWSVVDRPRVHMVKMFDDTYQPQCKSDTPVFWIIFLCIKGVWLLFGVVVSVLTRSVVKEYNNFTEFAYAMYNILIMVIIAVPLGILLQEVPNGTMIVSVVVIVLAFMFSTVILFFNIWYTILYSGNTLPSISSMHAKSSPSQSKISGGGNSSSSSRN